MGEYCRDATALRPLPLIHGLLEATLWIPTLAPLRRGFLFLPAGLLLGFPLVHSSASERGYPTQLRFPTPYSRAPSRFAKRPERRVPHSQPIRYRQRCNADRSGFCPDSAFGSKLAQSMPLSPHTKERLRLIDDQTNPEGHASETTVCAPPGKHIIPQQKQRPCDHSAGGPALGRPLIELVEALWPA
jgi:hypothetical protein